MKRRDQAVAEIEAQQFDVCVIGGGATGSGCAFDSQLRGLTTVLVDAGDFAGRTSSSSTKIVHGGVRYLEEAVKDLDPAKYHMVANALRERILMLRNAPHLAKKMEFLVPCFRWTDAAYYEAGLKFYGWISGSSSIFPSHFLSARETLRRLPTLKRNHLVGSIGYADGQFDDARYGIALVETFVESGGEALNYARVVDFEKSRSGGLRAVRVEDQLIRREFVIRARVFVNATGPSCDTIRTLARPNAIPRMRLSKGVHILLPLEVMPSAEALLIPKTEDGRVLFAIPWIDRLLVGTTEQEVSIHDELYVTKDEVAYLLQHLNQYLERPVAANQIVRGVAGVRPLVSRSDSRDTKKLARDHELEIDPATGLISIMGGKWTTYRAMSEATIDAVLQHLGLPYKASLTRDHSLVGAEKPTVSLRMSLLSRNGISEDVARHLVDKFASRATRVLELAEESPDLLQPVVNGSPVIRAEVTYCVRNEMAQTIEDVLFRRTGLQLYSWRSAIRAAPTVASILRRELNWSAEAENSAIQHYVDQIKRYLQLAGLESRATPDRSSSDWNDTRAFERIN
jgi:glycerol-3-phosphate dehydrogenase